MEGTLCGLSGQPEVVPDLRDSCSNVGCNAEESRLGSRREDMVHIDGKQNIADLFTRPLTLVPFQKYLKPMGMTGK